METELPFADAVEKVKTALRSSQEPLRPHEIANDAKVPTWQVSAVLQHLLGTEVIRADHGKFELR